MKTKATLIIGASVLAMFSCDTKNYTEQDRMNVTTELENFVDSVENAVQFVPVSDEHFDKMDERYDSLESKADKIYKDLDVEDANLEILEQRYESAIDNAKTQTKNFEETAKMHMSNVSTWWDKVTADIASGAKKTGDNIEDATQESLNWLEKNFDKLDENSRKKYEEITIKLEKD